MPPAVSLPPHDDATWEGVVAKAAPHVPDATARGAFDRCLYQFDQQRLDLPRLKDIREVWEFVAMQASKAADYILGFLPDAEASDDESPDERRVA